MTRLFLTAKNALTRKEEGATMVEFGLMLALIAAVCLAAVGLVGTQASAIFQQMQASL
jgi:pilus assembly protein Flp/PilA